MKNEGRRDKAVESRRVRYQRYQSRVITVPKELAKGYQTKEIVRDRVTTRQGVTGRNKAQAESQRKTSISYVESGEPSET